MSTMLPSPERCQELLSDLFDPDTFKDLEKTAADRLHVINRGTTNEGLLLEREQARAVLNVVLDHLREPK